MVDDIRLPKLFASVSAAGRINKINQRKSNANNKHFDRQVHEEQKKEDETEDDQAIGQGRQELKRKKLIGAGLDVNRNSYDDNKKDQGTLVDVVI